MSSLDMTVFHNLGSLILGFGTLIMAGWAVFVRARQSSAYLSAGSFGLCALSLLLQLAEIGHRVRTGDLSAVMDTMQAVWLAAAVLFSLTLIVNAAALLRHHRRG